MLFQEKFPSLFRNASPYWEMKWIKGTKKNATPKDVQADSAFEYGTFPTSLLRKVTSIRVKSTRTKGSSALITFENLTVLESDHPVFDASWDLGIWFGWWDFLAVKPNKALIMAGKISKTDFRYTESGISATIEVVNKSLAKLLGAWTQYPLPLFTKTGTEIKSSPSEMNAMYEIRKWSLGKFLNFMGTTLGVNIVYVPTEDSLAIDNARIDAITAKEREFRDSDSETTPLSPEFLSKCLLDTTQKYFPVWSKYGDPEYRKKLSEIWKLEVGGKSGNLDLKPTYYDLIFAVVVINYGMEMFLDGNTIIVASRDYVNELHYADKYFNYRGADYDFKTGKRTKMGESSKSTNLGYLDFLSEDVFEEFEVTDKPLLTAVTRNIIGINQREASATPATPATVTESKELEKTYDVSKVIGTDVVHMDEGLTKILENKALSWDQRNKAIENYLAQRKKGVKRASDEEVKNTINSKACVSLADVGRNRGLTKMQLLGQKADVRGCIGDHTLSPGGYFYFAGRYEDTGFYLVDEVEHIYDNQTAYKMNLSGTLVKKPELPPRSKAVLRPVKGSYIYIYTAIYKVGNMNALEGGTITHSSEMGQTTQTTGWPKALSEEKLEKHTTELSNSFTTQGSRGPTGTGEDYLSSAAGFKSGRAQVENVYPINVDYMRYLTEQDLKDPNTPVEVKETAARYVQWDYVVKNTKNKQYNRLSASDSRIGVKYRGAQATEKFNKVIEFQDRKLSEIKQKEAAFR